MNLIIIYKHHCALRGTLCALCSQSADRQPFFQEHNGHKGYTKHTKKEQESYMRIG